MEMPMNIAKMDSLYREAWVSLLKAKETQLRISMLDQAFSAVDKGIHAGGAFSCLIPLVALYYGGYIEFDTRKPTRKDLDVFVLSKGHAVAALASVYADLGFFSKDILKNSRSHDSILNGHPGPILPGVHISTGPLGEGICVAEGFATAGKDRFDVFTITGDGELQEGIAWESIIYAGAAGLSNLCVLVDNNNGQLDTVDRLLFPSADNLVGQFLSFGWNAVEVDARSVEGVLDELNRFKYTGSRGSRPTAIICKSRKGEGGFSAEIRKHKITISEVVYRNETALQRAELEKREEKLLGFVGLLNEAQRSSLRTCAKNMGILIGESDIGYNDIPTRYERADVRDKKIGYDDDLLPKIGKDSRMMCSDVIRDAMKVFAKDTRVVSLDSDLSSTSGLAAGVGFVDKGRGLNIGIAEANMMNIAEAYAVLGCNVWTSTFCPFFNWQVMRRIAVGQQERLEAIQAPNGWLNEGHALDITFLATASNLDTQVNGATHMGNDDIMVMDTVAGLRIIDSSCPQQLLGIMKWIMDGGKKLIYLRIMRAASDVLYDPGFVFEYGKGYILVENGKDIVLVSSGRGTHECIAASELLNENGVGATVVDMPSFEGEILKEYDGTPVVVVDQNNGYLYKKLVEYMAASGEFHKFGNITALNLLDRDGRPHFVHSGTYDELTGYYGLNAAAIAKTGLEVVKW
jgi:transketolase